MYAGLRGILADDAATAPPPTSGLDPRTKHGYGVTVSPSFAQSFWGAVSCPVLAIETPASPTPAEERAERLSWFGGETQLVEVDDVGVDAVITAVVTWATH